LERQYEPLPPNVDPEKAIHATGDAVLHPERGPTNCAYDQEFKFGPVDEDFGKADVVVRRKVKWSRSGAQPIETVGAIAEFDEGTGRFTCYANTSFYNVVNFVIAGALKGHQHILRSFRRSPAAASDRRSSPISTSRSPAHWRVPLAGRSNTFRTGSTISSTVTHTEAIASMMQS